jgi:hypothetical protein
VYGSQGYSVAGSSAQNPTYGTVTLANHASYQWAGSTTDTRALLKPGQSDRIAACWYSGSSFNIRVNNTDTAQHRVALYLLDWDNWGGGRQVRVEAWNTATNVKLGEQTVTGFQNGTYVVWNVQGDVTFRIVNLNSNAVVSGVFLDAPDSGVTASASFVRTDTTTRGNWSGVYGLDGYSLAGSSALDPSYASLTLSGQSFYQWAGSTTDTRALLKPGQSDRIAACWYTHASFDIRVRNTDANEHQVALYLLDWDNYWGGRQVRVEAWDTRWNIKLGEQEVSNFQNGTYLVWNVRGDVTFKVVNLYSNAVVSGVFFR